MLQKKWGFLIKEYTNKEAVVLRFRRGFDGLLEKIGGSKEIMKAGGRNIEFDESEVPLMRVIIKRLYEGDGLIADLGDDTKPITAEALVNLADSLVNEYKINGASEDEVRDFEEYAYDYLRVPQLVFKEKCIQLINEIISKNVDVQSKYQAECFKRIIAFLPREVVIDYMDTVDIINQRIDIAVIDKEIQYFFGTNNDFYDGYSSQDKEECMQIDKAILEMLHEDDDLRHYIKKKIGRKVEELF